MNVQKDVVSTGRLPAWLWMHYFEDNPKWPDLPAKLTRTLIMRQKARMLPVFLGVLWLLAVSYYGLADKKGDGLEKTELGNVTTKHSTFTLSWFRIAGSFMSVLASLFLFYASVFLEPPPSPESRTAVQASVVGPLLLLAHDVILAQLVCNIFGFVGELTMVANDPVTWLTDFAHAASPAMCAATATLGLLFWFCIRTDREWLQPMESLARANTGVVELQHLLHVGPFTIAWLDTFAVRDTRMLCENLPSFYRMAALLLLCGNCYFALCHVHAYLTEGCYVYPFIRHVKTFKIGKIFLLSFAAGVTTLCAIVYGSIKLRNCTVDA